MTQPVSIASRASFEVLANVTSDMQRDLKIVLGARAVMSEAIVKLTAEVRTGLAQLAEAQKHTDQRMDALILTVDEIIRPQGAVKSSLEVKVCSGPGR